MLKKSLFKGCPNCGAMIKTVDKFCPSCGSVVEKETKSLLEDEFECSVCGASVNSNAKFCPSCGEKFEDDVVISKELIEPEIEEYNIPKKSETKNEKEPKQEDPQLDRDSIDLKNKKLTKENFDELKEESKHKKKRMRQAVLIIIGIILLILTVSQINKQSSGDDYYNQITTLINGIYYGYSNTKIGEYIGIERPQMYGSIELQGSMLSKEEENYKPILAESSTKYAMIVLDWEGPIKTKEVGIIKSQKIIWSEENGRLVIIGDWESISGSTASFNISPIDTGKNAGKIYTCMFTDYWEVWGYKSVDEETFKNIVDLFNQYYNAKKREN